MGERATAARLATTATTRRLAVVALGTAAWFASFAVLARQGTWTPFALAGTALAVLAIGIEAVPVALLQPSPGKVGSGLLAGVLMVLFTHAAYAGVAPLLPEARAATARLFVFLNVGGFSPAARAGLIVLIATCEEILFRGTLACAPGKRPEYRLRRIAHGDFLQVVAFAACYALAALPLGSPLLVLCALLCGVIWGVLRLVTGSLVVPIITHVVWDLGVLVVWPLVAGDQELSIAQRSGNPAWVACSCTWATFSSAMAAL